MEWRVPLSDLDYGLEEEQAALDVIRRRWLTMGAVTQEFERAFSDLTRCQVRAGGFERYGCAPSGLPGAWDRTRR